MKEVTEEKGLRWSFNLSSWQARLRVLIILTNIELLALL